MEKEGLCSSDSLSQVDIYQTPILLSQLNGSASSAQGALKGTWTWHVEKHMEKCIEIKSSRVDKTHNIISLTS